MRINEPVTNRQKDYEQSQKIVSTTDTKGVITSINKDFIDISGFTEEELIGQAHNLVRHPSMPQAAFAELWDYNKIQKPWIGMVKNRCKNGDHYWVDAFVTPILTNGRLEGYQSVRQKPTEAMIANAEREYQRKPTILHRITAKILSLPMSIKLFISFTLISLIAIATQSLPIMIAVIVAGNLLASVIIARPWEQFARSTESIFSSDIAKKIYTRRHDELGQLQLIVHFLSSQQNTILYRAGNVSDEVKTSATQAQQESANIKKDTQTLYSEVEMAVTATEEMTATIQEVAKNASATSVAANDSKESVTSGKERLRQTKVTIDQLASAMEQSSTIVENLNDESTKIGGVIEVINGIAEQTNLLALNAAIEAARAGEQGRGFAVVADEVRALAGKTQESTSQIRQMIDLLQSSAEKAVNAMKESHGKVNSSVENITDLTEQFNNMMGNVEKISDMCIQIATATEEQSTVAEEINRNIHNINEVGRHTLEATERATQSNQQLVNSVDVLHNTIHQFT